MPRRPRIHLAGGPLHSVQRGHNRETCFCGEDDYLAYRHGLGEALKESGCALHAYVLMSNPVHMLLTPPQPQDIPRLIISLGRRSVRYINKTYYRTGTLWDSPATSRHWCKKTPRCLHPHGYVLLVRRERVCSEVGVIDDPHYAHTLMEV